MKKPSPILILRFSFAVLFLWFGYQQLMDPGAWVAFLPNWIGYIPMPAQMFVQLNGWFEIMASIALIAGVFVRPVAVFLALHLFGIAVTAGGAIGVRDAVLAMIGIALGVAEPDSLTLDSKKTI